MWDKVDGEAAKSDAFEERWRALPSRLEKQRMSDLRRPSFGGRTLPRMRWKLVPMRDDA